MGLVHGLYEGMILTLRRMSGAQAARFQLAQEMVPVYVLMDAGGLVTSMLFTVRVTNSPRSLRLPPWLTETIMGGSGYQHPECLESLTGQLFFHICS